MQYRGLIIALLILILWLFSLVFLLNMDLATHWIPAIFGFFLQIFQYTGLFITAHDAMHGTVIREFPRLNHWIGGIAVFFYAFMWYPFLRDQHQYHHKYPASESDPDYHRPDKGGFFAWYLHFLLHYIRWWQVLGIAVVFNILHHLLGISVLHLLLFWVIPSILSTFQLFYFGTYLPHRDADRAFPDHHRAHSLDFGTFLSFVSCYHFGGYHHEHHLHPGIPWWKLPSSRKE